jgi:hypothetical protein
MKEGERYHLKGRVAKMETISNPCANKEAIHKDHARRA